MKDRAFFFGSYEGYRLDAGKNFVEAVPSAAAWARAVPAVAGAAARLHWRRAPCILPGASTNPDFDIAQLQDTQDVTENSFSGRLDFKMNDNWSAYVRVFHDQGTSDRPAGRHRPALHITVNPTNAVFNLQGLLGGGMINEFKFGYNAAPSTDGARSPGRLREHPRSASAEPWPTPASPDRAAAPGSPARAAWFASTARATAAARRTTRTR